MRKPFLLSATVVLALAACAPGADDAPVQTSLRSQAGVVATPWLPVSPAETRVSIVGDDPVTARRSRWEPAKRLYAEAMQLPNGNMLFEKRRRVPAGQALPADEELVKRYAASKAAAEAGIVLDKAKVQRRKLDSGEVHYLVGQDKRKCVVFFLYAPESLFAARDGVEPNYQAVNGIQCESPDSPRAAQLEQQVFDLVGRVRFDEGRQSRTKIFAAALAQLRERPLPEDVEPKAARGDKAPPAIQVPAAVKAEQELAEVRGVVKDASGVTEVRLDGKWVHVGSDGTFRTRRPVEPGTSTMTLTAVDQLGNTSQTRLLVDRIGAGQQTRKPLGELAGRYHALVIGVKTYQAPIPGLITPFADAEALSNVLRRDYGFRVTTLLDAGKQQIVDAMTRLRNELTEDDNLLVYYAGHGVLDPDTNLGYWLPTDARADAPDNWISNKTVARLLKAIPARHVVLIADACYSGAFAREQNLLTGGQASGDLTQLVWLRSRTAFSSGELEEVMDEGGGNNSLFAMHFLETLRKNTGVVSGRLLSGTVRTLVRAEAAQTPQYGAVVSAGHDDGADFLFVRRSGGQS